MAERPDNLLRTEGPLSNETWALVAIGLQDAPHPPSLALPLLHDPALRRARGRLLAALDPSIGMAEVEATEEVRLDLEDGRTASLRIVAVSVAAGIGRAV